jgi:branched-chain amino acid transport system substrate-binding protein
MRQLASIASLVGTIVLVSAVSARAAVTVGVLMPMSGFAASYGHQEQGAIDMFMEKYSGLGMAGKLKLVIYDTRGDNTQAISLTRRLIDSDNVAAIVGPYLSGESQVAFPVAKTGQTPIVTPTSAKPGITATGQPWSFRFASTTAQIDSKLLDYWLKAHAPIKKVVVFYDAKDAVSSSDGKMVFPAALKAHGIDVLDAITFQTGDIDYSAQVTRAKALNPDGIVVAALYTEAAHLVAEVRRQGMTQPIVAGVEVLDPHFITIAGAAANGVTTATDFYANNPRLAVQAFTAEFEKRLHVAPTNSAGLMYDTLFLMRHCIMTTGVKDSSQASKDKIRDCWAHLKDVDAPLSGPNSMDPSGDVIRTPTLLVVKDGQFTSLH